MSKPKVYFIKTVSPENIVKAYDALKKELPGKVCVKVHSGEEGNQNFLGPDYFKPMIERVKGTPCEANAAYKGARHTNELHKKLLEKHGWTAFNFDLLDEEGDLELEIPNGTKIKKNFVGTHMTRYESMLVLSHFKGKIIYLFFNRTSNGRIRRSHETIIHWMWIN